MASLPPRTLANLKASYGFDSQATRMWEYFARIAEHEGFGEVANLFRQLSEAQAICADGHLDFLMAGRDPLSGTAVGDTQSNLRAAVAVELRDVEASLNDMAQTARAEGAWDVASWFDTVAQHRRAQAEHLAAALDTLQKAKR